MAAVEPRKPRRWTFAALPYQRGIAAALARALGTGRLAHAYLFAGPRGVGKEAVAYALAAAALCPEQPGEGCGECNTCRRVFADVHPDVRRYETAGAHFDLDLVREILAEAGRPPSEGRRKVLVVVEPEKMTVRSDAPANAFLKTLEEPPGNSTFLLLSHDPRQLLATVVSRCVAVHFPRLTTAEVTEALVRDYGRPASEAAELAAWAEGTLTEASAAGAAAEAARYEGALAVMEAVVRGGVVEALEAAQATRQREEALALVAACADLAHEVAALRAGTPEALRLPAWEGRCRDLAASGGLPSAEELWEGCGKAALALRGNCNVALTLEELFLSWVP
jgi:DNA polymerase-3 subunit delta'